MMGKKLAILDAATAFLLVAAAGTMYANRPDAPDGLLLPTLIETYYASMAALFATLGVIEVKNAPPKKIVKAPYLVPFPPRYPNKTSEGGSLIGKRSLRNIGW